jgi:hypothetical protein
MRDCPLLGFASWFGVSPTSDDGRSFAKRRTVAGNGLVIRQEVDA